MNYLRLASAVLALGIISIGCVSSIPLNSSLNDFVSMGTKVNSKADISFSYSSSVVDSVFKPYTKDKQAVNTSHPGFQMAPSATLKKMVTEYISNKFSKLSDSSTTKLSVGVKDFWIEQYSTDSKGAQVMVALAGGETNLLCVAKVKVEVKMVKDSQEIVKILSPSSEANFVYGVGTGTATSNVYQGQNSIENVHAKNINTLFNKVIMMMNSFLEENGL